MARSKKARNWAIGGGLLGTIVAGLIAFWPRKADAADVDDGGGELPDVEDEDATKPPYPLPRPYAPSETKCFRSGEFYNLAILETPEQVSDVLYYLGFPIGPVELMQADAVASTPIWVASEGYTPATSQRLKSFQAAARSLNLPGHKNAPASAVDGVYGECTAVSIGHAAALQEEGKWPYKPTARSNA